MKKTRRSLKTRVGRVHRGVSRQLDQLAPPARTKTEDLLERNRRILTLQIKDKHKLYALHAPEVECISKGKARVPYEFGMAYSR